MEHAPDANGRWLAVRVVVVLLTIALYGMVVRVAAQDSIPCPDYGNEYTLGGCTEWGWGDDENIRSSADGWLDGIYFRSDPFCDRVMGEAESWLAGFTTGVAGVLEHDGDQLSAASQFWSSGTWESGYVRDWVRDTTFTIAERAQELGEISLHESGHKTCYEGDSGGPPCDYQDEDQMQPYVTV